MKFWQGVEHCCKHLFRSRLGETWKNGAYSRFRCLGDTIFSAFPTQKTSSNHWIRAYLQMLDRTQNRLQSDYASWKGKPKFLAQLFHFDTRGSLDGYITISTAKLHKMQAERPDFSINTLCQTSKGVNMLNFLLFVMVWTTPLPRSLLSFISPVSVTPFICFLPSTSYIPFKFTPFPKEYDQPDLSKNICRSGAAKCLLTHTYKTK